MVKCKILQALKSFTPWFLLNGNGDRVSWTKIVRNLCSTMMVLKLQLHQVSIKPPKLYNAVNKMKWIPKHMLDKIEKYYRCEVKNTKILRKKLENKRTNSLWSKEKPVWRCILLLKKTTALQPRKEVGWLQSCFFFLTSPSVSPSSITNLITNSVTL